MSSLLCALGDAGRVYPLHPSFGALVVRLLLRVTPPSSLPKRQAGDKQPTSTHVAWASALQHAGEDHAWGDFSQPEVRAGRGTAGVREPKQSLCAEEWGLGGPDSKSLTLTERDAGGRGGRRPALIQAACAEQGACETWGGEAGRWGGRQGTAVRLLG